MIYKKNCKVRSACTLRPGLKTHSAIYFCCLVWPHPLNRMISRAMLWTAGPPSGAWAVDSETCCCAFMFEFKGILLLECIAEAKGPSKLSRKQPLGNQNAHLGRKHLQWQRLSSVICFSLFLCLWAPNSWLSLVGSFPFWIQFWASGLNFLLASLVAAPGGRETTL